jgi:hypothetical protein
LPRGVFWRRNGQALSIPGIKKYVEQTALPTHQT